MILYHSAKGTKWKNHKYIAIKNGRYIYPNKRQGAKAKMRMNKLSSESASIVRNSVNPGLSDSRRFESTVSGIAKGIGKSNASISDFNITEYVSSKKNNVETALEQLKDYSESMTRKIVTEDAAQKAMKAGEIAIKQILNIEFKSTGIIDMEGRGMKTTLGFELGERKIGKH